MTKQQALTGWTRYAFALVRTNKPAPVSAPSEPATLPLSHFLTRAAERVYVGTVVLALVMVLAVVTGQTDFASSVR